MAKKSTEYTLTKRVQKRISEIIDDLYQKAKFRFLGPSSVDKQIAVTHIPELSLPGIFTAGANIENVKANSETLESLINTASLYMDSLKEQTKAKTIQAVTKVLADAKAKRIEPHEAQEKLADEMEKVWDKASSQMETIAAVESQTAKNMSVMDGIMHVNAQNAISDPVVYFIVTHDHALCDECKRLHLMPDGVTPRLWYLSEVGSGYHKKGEPNPKVGGLHPHCRCTMLTLLPGYTFDASGHVRYKDRNWLEMDEQRGTT